MERDRQHLLSQALSPRKTNARPLEHWLEVSGRKVKSGLDPTLKERADDLVPKRLVHLNGEEHISVSTIRSGDWQFHRALAREPTPKVDCIGLFPREDGIQLPDLDNSHCRL